LSEKLCEMESSLEEYESKMKKLLDELIEMDKRFRTYLIPPLPHETLSFIHTLSDFLREFRNWVDEWNTYRKAIKESLLR